MKALKTVGDAVQMGRHGRRMPVTEQEREHKAKVERDLKAVESEIGELKRRELAVA